MQITVQLPDDIQTHENPGREALEALVIAAFEAGMLSSYQAQVLLGFETRYELDGFLKSHDVATGAYGIEQYEQDLRTIDEMLPRVATRAGGSQREE